MWSDFVALLSPRHTHSMDENVKEIFVQDQKKNRTSNSTMVFKHLQFFFRCNHFQQLTLIHWTMTSATRYKGIPCCFIQMSSFGLIQIIPYSINVLLLFIWLYSTNLYIIMNECKKFVKNKVFREIKDHKCSECLSLFCVYDW